MTFMLQEYNFQVVQHASIINQNVDGLSQNPCISQHDNSKARWHGEINEDEEMVLRWHVWLFKTFWQWKPLL